MPEPYAAHAEHKILELPTYASRWVKRICTTCEVEIEPRKEPADA